MHIMFNEWEATALLTWFIRRPDDGPIGTETCSLPFIKYDVPDVNCFIILVIKRALLIQVFRIQCFYGTSNNYRKS
jgi:hypothetical protein